MSGVEEIPVFPHAIFLTWNRMVRGTKPWTECQSEPLPLRQAPSQMEGVVAVDSDIKLPGTFTHGDHWRAKQEVGSFSLFYRVNILFKGSDKQRQLFAFDCLAFGGEIRVPFLLRQNHFSPVQKSKQAYDSS